MRFLAHILRQPLGLLSSALGLLFLAGCTSVPRRTQVESGGTLLPARLVSNFFVVESRWDDGKTYRFLIDTGSTISYVTPELARHFGVKPKKGPAPAKVPVRSANGGQIELDPVTLRRVMLGGTSFQNVAAVVFDFTDLSDHLDLHIDGIIGFPVFREVLLTLDYPGARLGLAPAVPGAPAPKAALRTATLAFNNEQHTPLIPVQLGTESFIVLVDSGSDGSLSLNPAGLHPRFAAGPRAGTLISSLSGDRPQLTGRLGQTLLIGPHVVTQPVVDLTDQLSSIGGELLRHFKVTFDQSRNEVTLVRESDGPVTMAPRRHPGLSFARSPIYWRVLGVIPDTPAARLPVQAGDLCVRINGEMVDKWTFDRYAALIKSAAKITYTFLHGTKEEDVEVPVFELVP
ncbi:MAG: aspartyl protease family protein [Lacunisphaera sp.]|nr:aspartyl protease family protein [Lacunisphaera sp.]